MAFINPLYFDEVLNALAQAAQQFRHYEHLHLKKGTEDCEEKAKVNEAFAKLCEDALHKARTPL